MEVDDVCYLEYNQMMWDRRETREMAEGWL